MHANTSDHHSPGRYPANGQLFNEMRNSNYSGGVSIVAPGLSSCCAIGRLGWRTPDLSSKERVDHYDPVRAAAG